MPSASEQLLALVPAPSARTPFNWSPTEEVLGRRLPQDFTKLVDVYGDVEFGGLFRLLRPSSTPFIDLVTGDAAIPRKPDKRQPPATE